jgi:poly-beta-1,6-N-acetyl-D-glucosamine synthase
MGSDRVSALGVAFWVCAGSLCYIYLGYPVLAWMLARAVPRPWRKAPFTGSFSVVIAAHNEASVLPVKIRSLLASNVAGQMVEIIVASDGSTDNTEAVLRELGERRVRFVGFSDRRGKATVLNDAIPLCRSDVVILTDARQEVAPEALGLVLSGFADEQIGVVSGELVFRHPAGGVQGSIDAYWRYEKFVRKQESRRASVPGATGALYAIRKKLFRSIPSDTLLDDVLIPMQAMAQGYRCVLEDGAVVYDEPSGTPEEEAVRKRRTLAGNAQLLEFHPEWLLPWAHPAWFQFVSHKILRLLSPLLLVVGLATNMALVATGGWSAVFGSLLLLQALFYALAGLGWLCQRCRCSMGVWSAPFMFVALNVTTALAVVDALCGRYKATWQRSRVVP